MAKRENETTQIDQIIRSKRKTIALEIRSDGQLIVRAPNRVLKRDIERVVQEQSVWIIKKRQAVLERAKQYKPKQYQDGEPFLYLGEFYPLSIVNGNTGKLHFDGRRFLMSKNLQPVGYDVFKTWYQVQAKQVLTKQVTTFALKTGLSYKTIRITSARTRWGSYSSRGTVSFPWRLVMAPLPMINYVVVHELVHSKHPNHSKAFWADVAKIIPDYKQCRAWFKTNGRLLSLDGQS